jgi:hypothetical protein
MSNASILQLSDGRDCWFGRASSDFITNHWNPNGADLNEFVERIKSGLVKQDQTEQQFSYAIAGNGTPQFEVKEKER